jgi:glutathione peroxidase
MGDKMRKLKRFFIVLLLLVAAFIVYVEIVNRNSKNMTYRQKVLKAVYPVWMWWTKLTGEKSKKLLGGKQPLVSFYTLTAIANNGVTVRFELFKGKKVLLVNTASNCVYTNQYDDLQALSEKYKDELLVLGFPSNDFKQQEKGTDAEIAEFCRQNFGVTFPLMKKSVVVKRQGQNEVFQWLTDPAKNGWNSKQPTWNFSKYLVDENGVLINYFDPSVSPLGADVQKAIKN